MQQCMPKPCMPKPVTERQGGSQLQQGNISGIGSQVQHTRGAVFHANVPLLSAGSVQVCSPSA